MTAEEFAERRATALRMSRDGKTLREIGDALGISKDTVRRDLEIAEAGASRDKRAALRRRRATGETTPLGDETAPAPDEAPTAVSRDSGATEADVSRDTLAGNATDATPQVVTVAVDADLDVAFATLSHLNCTREEAIAFAVTRLATAYRAARRTGRLPDGPIEVTSMTLESAGVPVAPADETPAPPAVQARAGGAAS